MTRVDAPFTVDQVTSLNEYQRSGVGHPFTCPALEHRGNHSDGEGVLVAVRGGWMCPDGDGYTQTWAHSFMADGSWRRVSLLDIRRGW